MNLEYPQLAALVAVVREGSFEAAARTLHVTTSAVSQRIKLLEEQVGAVLIVRGTPCRATTLGESLYQHGLKVALLERELLEVIGPPKGGGAAEPPSVGIAVNADSLGTWLLPGLANFVAEKGHHLDILVDDQEDTAGWLRSGRVLGAITAEAKAVQGCQVEPLGVMRYLATATPRFVERWFPGGFTAVAVKRAPVLMFNRKDHLQERFVRRVLGAAASRALRGHFVPSPAAFLEASLLELGWGLNPESLVDQHLAKKRLLDLAPGRWLDIPLYWQRWALSSPGLDALTASLRAQAKKTLRPL